jgi:serine/threonine protein phosphatase PrpC
MTKSVNSMIIGCIGIIVVSVLFTTSSHALDKTGGVGQAETPATPLLPSNEMHRAAVASSSANSHSNVGAMLFAPQAVSTNSVSLVPAIKSSMKTGARIEAAERKTVGAQYEQAVIARGNNFLSAVTIMILVAGLVLSSIFVGVLLSRSWPRPANLGCTTSVGMNVAGGQVPATHVTQAPPAIAIPVQATKLSVPSVEEEIQALIEYSTFLGKGAGKAMPPSATSDMAVHSEKGAVRETNQDFATCFRMKNGIRIMIEGDGVASIPFGKEASFIAVDRVARYLIEHLPASCWFSASDLEAMARQAIHHAALSLALEADKTGVKTGAQTHCTTISLVLATKTYFVTAFSGDGLGLISRADGSVEVFLNPQRETVGSRRVLTSCLSPSTVPAPIVKICERRPGDICLLTTDGCSDFIRQDVLISCVKQAVCAFNGDVDSAIAFVVNQMTEANVNGIWSCTDNITGGIITDPSVMYQ